MVFPYETGLAASKWDGLWTILIYISFSLHPAPGNFLLFEQARCDATSHIPAVYSKGKSDLPAILRKIWDGGKSNKVDNKTNLPRCAIDYTISVTPNSDA